VEVMPDKENALR